MVQPKNMKVKFCTNGPMYGNSRTEDFGTIASVNPAWLFLQKYYDIHGKNPNTVWLSPNLVVLDSADIIIAEIISQKPDVLGLGVYIWNYELQFDIAQQVKLKLPDTLIVLGGPQLSVHKMDDPNQESFFIQHPYVDYVVYGDGEKPFTQIIDYHSGYLSDKSTFVNIVENANGTRKLYPYELLSDDQYLSQSPYLDRENDMIKIRDYLVERGIPRQNQLWTVEFARGCMYSCSFCDWSQNLSKKVKRRTHNWKDDIDLFHRLDVGIRESDANFGQWEEDIQVFDYACSLYDPQRNFSFSVTNTPKLKKEATEYLIVKGAQTYPWYRPMISIQDLHQDTLSAIDRPTVSWDKMIEMIKSIRTKLPKEKFSMITVETILGLPNQTIENIVETYVKFFELGLTQFTWHWWWMLENSPGADKNYQKIWKLDAREVYYLPPGVTQIHVSDLDTFCKSIAIGTVDHGIIKKKPIVVSSNKMNMQQLWAAKILYTKWTEFNKHINTVDTYNTTQIEKILQKLLTLSMKDAEQQLDLQRSTIEKYGVILWGYYDANNKILYSEF
jgi:putative methyltransferase